MSDTTRSPPTSHHRSSSFDQSIPVDEMSQLKLKGRDESPNEDSPAHREEANEYKFDPEDFERVQQAIALIFEPGDLQLLHLNLPFVAFVEGTIRVAPYCSEALQEVVENVLAPAWRQSVEEFRKVTSIHNESKGWTESYWSPEDYDYGAASGALGDTSREAGEEWILNSRGDILPASWQSSVPGEATRKELPGTFTAGKRWDNELVSHWDAGPTPLVSRWDDVNTSAAGWIGPQVEASKKDESPPPSVVNPVTSSGNDSTASLPYQPEGEQCDDMDWEIVDAEDTRLLFPPPLQLSPSQNDAEPSTSSKDMTSLSENDNGGLPIGIAQLLLTPPLAQSSPPHSEPTPSTSALSTPKDKQNDELQVAFDLLTAIRKQSLSTSENPPTIDETKIPHRAWLLHPERHLRILAAARYIDTFNEQGILIMHEPMIHNVAHPEALEILYRGGHENVFAAEAFLKSFRRQEEWERRNGYAD